MTNKLNKEQQQLVEDNHNLIYGIMHQYKLSLDAPEDYYGAAAVGLCNAALHYDPDRNIKFSTYAYICMGREIQREKDINRTNDMPTLLSLDADCITENKNPLSFKDVIKDRYDYISSKEILVALEQACNEFTNEEKLIFDLLTQRFLNFREIGEELGLSKQCVHQKFIKMRNKISHFLTLDDFKI